jgi:hypothetical protein
MQNLCIAPAVFWVTLIVGLGTMLTAVGVVAIVIGVEGEIDDVRLRPLAATDVRFASGDTVEVSAVVDASITGGGALIGHYSHWQPHGKSPSACLDPNSRRARIYMPTLPPAQMTRDTAI